MSETSPSFASSSRSKRSFGCNVKTEEGLEIIHQLIAESDVLVENSATGVESLGLGYEDLQRCNPNIVMISSQLVGSRGPNSHWTGTVQQPKPMVDCCIYGTMTTTMPLPQTARFSLIMLLGVYVAGGHCSANCRDARGGATHTEALKLKLS